MTRLRTWWSNERVRMAAIFLAALAVRALAVAAWGDTPPVKDGQEYSIYAINLLRGRGFGAVFSIDLPAHETLRAFRMPLYPLFIAWVYSWFGISYWAVRVAQMLLGAAGCLLVYRIARRLCGRRTALIAGMLACIWPALLAYVGLLMTETLFTTLVLLAVDRCLAAMDRPTGWRCVAAGVSLAFVMLTRAQGLGLVLGLAGVICWQAARRRTMRWGAAGLLLGACLLTYAPWVVRNWMVFHRFVPLTSQAGAAFGIRNSSDAGGGIYRSGEAVSRRGHELYTAAGHDEFAWSSSLWGQGWAFIRQHPLKFMQYVIERAGFFWSVHPDVWVSRWQGWLRIGFYAATILGWGLMLNRQPASAWLLLVLVFGYALPLWAVGNGDTRVRVPIEPFLIIMAAYMIGRQPATEDAAVVSGPAPRNPLMWHPAAIGAGALALAGAAPLQSIRHPGHFTRAFEYAAYVRLAAAPSPAPSGGPRVNWAGGLYYNMLPASELRSAFAEQSVCLINLNLTPRTFGEGLVVVTYDGPLPTGLAYEHALEGSGTVVGLWHQLLVVRADRLARQTS